MYNRSISFEENGISRPCEDVGEEKQRLPGDPVVAKVGENDSRSKGGWVLQQLRYSERGWGLEGKRTVR